MFSGNRPGELVLHFGASHNVKLALGVTTRLYLDAWLKKMEPREQRLQEYGLIMVRTSIFHRKADSVVIITKTRTPCV